MSYQTRHEPVLLVCTTLREFFAAHVAPPEDSRRGGEGSTQPSCVPRPLTGPHAIRFVSGHSRYLWWIFFSHANIVDCFFFVKIVSR